MIDYSISRLREAPEVPGRILMDEILLYKRRANYAVSPTATSLYLALMERLEGVVLGTYVDARGLSSVLNFWIPWGDQAYYQAGVMQHKDVVTFWVADKLSVDVVMEGKTFAQLYDELFWSTGIVREAYAKLR